jgi:hypothetical protein
MCCSLELKDLHELLHHFEEAHATSKGMRLANGGDASASHQHPQFQNALRSGSGELDGYEEDDEDEEEFYLCYGEDFDLDEDDLDHMEIFELETPQGFLSSDDDQGEGSSLTFTDLYLNGASPFLLTPSASPKPSPLSTTGLKSASRHKHQSSISSTGSIYSSAPPTPTLRKSGSKKKNGSNLESTTTASIPMSDIYCKRDDGEGMDLDEPMSPGPQVMVTTPVLPLSPITSTPTTPSYGRHSNPLLLSLDGVLNFQQQQLQHQEDKDDRPYKCKVPGCTKAYKNPGGLKYHMQHGHCEDTGDPEINNLIHKPYQCSVPDCGRRYKNMNGLKVSQKSFTKNFLEKVIM